MSHLGPDAPTKCEGWTIGDLAAHLVVREGRLDAGPGILLRPLAGYTERVRRRTRDSVPFPELLRTLRQGPPRWSPYGLPGMDRAANTVEYFTHHEDVRRAQPGWAPRELDPDLEEFLWRRLRLARFIMRKIPVEVTAVRPDGKSQRITKGSRQARVHGAVGDLTLWVLGRTDVAEVRFTGEADAVRAITEGRWRL
jgi:uncharacterized protein (TIGR03085 family)